MRRKAPDLSTRSASGPYDELVPFDGHLERPVLTMHGTGDLFVPIHLEQTLNRAVAAAGTSDLRDAGRQFTDPVREGDPGGLTVGPALHP